MLNCMRRNTGLCHLCVNRMFLNNYFPGLVNSIVILVHACCNELQPSVWIAFFVLQFSVKGGRECFTGV